MNSRHVWLCFFVAATIPTRAQIAFDHLTKSDGLPSFAVTDIIEDSLGFIWFSSEAGLARYDGTRVETDIAWEVSPDQPYRGVISELCDVFDDQLTFVTYTDYLMQLDLRTGRVSQILGPEMHGSIGSSAFDASGQLWVTTKQGVFRRDGETYIRVVGINTPKVTHDTPTSIGIPHTLKCIAFDQEGTPWFAGNGGLYTKPQDRDRAIELYSEVISCMAIRGDRVCALSQTGVVMVNRITHEIRRFSCDIPPLIGSEQIAFDPEGALWIAAGGLLRLDLDTSQLSVFTPDPSDPFSVSGRSSAVMFDRQGRLWAASEGAVDMADVARRRIRYIRPAGQSGANVFSLATDKNGTVWGQMGDGSVASLTGQTRVVLNPDSPVPHNLPTATTTRLHVDSTNTLWICSLVGAFPYSIDQDRIDLGQVISGPVTVIHELSNGELLFGALGIKSYQNGRTQTLIQRVFTRSSRTLTTIIPLQTDRFLVASAEEIGEWHRDTNQVAYFEGLPDALDPSPFVLHALRDSHGRVWISTYGHGLWTLNQGQFHELDDALAFEYVYGGVEAKNGDLWFATNNGLIHVFEGGWSREAHAAGFPVLEFNGDSFAASNSGMLYFGSYEGVFAFDVSRLIAAPNPPPVFFTGLFVRNQPVRYLEQLDKALIDRRLEYMDQLHLSHKEDFVGLQFAAPSTSAQDAQFRYQIKGLSDEWLPCLPQERISFTDMRAGSYQIRVQATNDRSSWSAQEARLNVIVAPAPWETWWARSLAVTFLMLGALAIYRIRMGQALAVARLRQRIANDLHDDLGVMLTHIAQTAELGKVRSQGDVRQTFEQVADLARTVIQHFRDVLWTLDQNNESWNTLIARMRLFASSTLNRAQIQLEFQRKVQGQGDGWQVGHTRELFLIFKEAIHNVVKHAQATQVDIRTEIDPGHFRFVIHDNGRGLDAQAPIGKGLASMRTRAKGIGADLQVESKNGVRIQLTMPI
ncbi:MAG: hypothetical protein KDC35_07310 [Acidobacteria bacterium]|nr:hypothetical protein [Acidobacteriota bacterium]